VRSPQAGARGPSRARAASRRVTERGDHGILTPEGNRADDMPTRRGQKSEPGPGAWSREIEAATRAFAFLVDELESAPPAVSAGPRECALTWVLADASVRVFFEPFALPHAGVRVFSAEEPRRALADLPLLLLVRDAAPAQEDVLRSLTGPPEETLPRLAGFVRRAAGDLLCGDRARLPRLLRAAADERRRRAREQFGTSTGESPRFDRRPSLAELFSDVTNEGLRAPRAYQAFWDYDYPLAAIATFLGCDEPAVQALLDVWDGV
jgi:hypothetical protein